MPAALDLVGRRFGRLVVTARAGSRGGHSAWACSCDCGGMFTADASTLVAGKARSCGCLRAENARRCGALSDGSANIKHGLSTLAEYRVWSSMRQRAAGKGPKKDRERYAGIGCCERWASFENFIVDMGLRPSPAHSLDRTDNAKGYGPENCRWVTAVEQSANKRPRRTAREVHAARAAFLSQGE